MLRIWEDDPYSGSVLSQDGEQTAPLIFKVPPTGGTVEVKLWLRHDELSGEEAESSYDVFVEGADDFPPDNSGWIEVAPDVAGVAGTYVPQLDIGNILVGMIVPFWVRITVPDTPETGVHEDIYLKVTTSSTPHFRKIDLRKGVFYNCAFSSDTNTIDFDVTNTNGSWRSEWIDVSALSDLNYIEYDFDGPAIYINYRTSSDGTEETATSWVGDIAEVDFSADFWQVQVEFVSTSDVGTQGLVRRIYGNTDFSVYKATTVGGVIPHSATPGDSFPAPKSIKWTGYFKALEDGLHTFRLVSNDGHRLLINNNLICENWSTTSGNTTVSSNGNAYLKTGWNFIEVQYYHADGTNTISCYVDAPTGSERAVTLADFTPTQMVTRIESISFRYQGPKAQQFDLQVYDGPDVPVLISPNDNFITPLFSPPLTVFQRNCEYVEFQMDKENSFASQYLVSWIDPVTPESEHTSTAPTNRPSPPGIWFWRARGITNGQYSEWSDYRFMQIEALIPQSQFLYLNANISLPVHDSIVDDRFVYVNANVGVAPHDPIVDPRGLYVNVNVETAVGKVIYPLYDYTPVRKTEFDGDDDFVIG